jgi:DUF1365 family protein
MHSCLYFGRVAHVRREPVVHRFRYAVAMAYLDLDEAPMLLRASRILSAARLAPLSFRVDDHGKGLEASDSPGRLADAVRDAVERNGGRRPTGPVRLLTQLRHSGIYFSPLNLYFCFDADGETVPAIVAEVSNTPWNERRHYVLDDRTRVNASGGLRFRHGKDFHVSPFMSMDATYRWKLTPPGNRLTAHIRSTGGARAPFDAVMALARQPWTDANLLRLLARFPAAKVQILAAIYWQAFRLWIKRCPYFPHPNPSAQLR